MRHTPYQTALVLALLFSRSSGSRARFSDLTLRKVSRRKKLRSAFLTDVRDELDDLGFAFLEIDRGYAIVPMAALNGAPAVTAKKFMPEFGKGKPIDFTEIEKELGIDDEDDLDAEDS